MISRRRTQDEYFTIVGDIDDFSFLYYHYYASRELSWKQVILNESPALIFHGTTNAKTQEEEVNAMKHLSFICFIIFILDLAISAENRVRSPLGPKMCDMLCRHTYGCSVFVFSRSHLTCCIACQQSNFRGLTVLVNNTEFQDRSVRAPCGHLSVIINSRAGTPRCVKEQSEVPLMRGQNVELLITQHMSSEYSSVYRYSVTHGSYDVITNTTFKHVKAMSYSIVARTLLSSLDSPQRIVITYLDSSTVKLIKASEDCCAMTLDSSRGIFLLAVVKQDLHICTLAVNGTSFKHLFSMQSRKLRHQNIASAMVVDSTRNLLYVCLPLKILSVDYSGKIEEVFRGGSLQGLALNPSENILYFGHSMSIKGLLLFGKHLETYAELRERLFSIVYQEDHLVYNLRYSRLLYSTHVENRNETSSFKIRELPKGQQLVTCPLH